MINDDFEETINAKPESVTLINAHVDIDEAVIITSQDHLNCVEPPEEKVIDTPKIENSSELSYILKS